MKIITILITLTLTSISFAGPGGGHSHGHGHSHSAPMISKEKTEKIGREHIQRLIKAKKIDTSWLNSKFDKSEMKKNEWIVTFDNDKGVKGKKLYIFLKKSGGFVAANFSGK
ncbi:DUF6488 family protein [Halobacteriovorax sp. JY17]|uniref:DUF6488 family protein n=1 Tax=Halobacteriovorax sp. JY17 TaxID=2014617 RepID=UPI000C49B399|nr:DUF6488 family protein [Halobacteriovorax sp. JY17]PIK14099.1 MAG: hypothetical protein CES88_14040 [Halobacteriovorax sp. JY17]